MTQLVQEVDGHELVLDTVKVTGVPCMYMEIRLLDNKFRFVLVSTPSTMAVCNDEDLVKMYLSCGNNAVVLDKSDGVSVSLQSYGNNSWYFTVNFDESGDISSKGSPCSFSVNGSRVVSERYSIAIDFLGSNRIPVSEYLALMLLKRKDLRMDFYSFVFVEVNGVVKSLRQVFLGD